MSFPRMWPTGDGEPLLPGDWNAVVEGLGAVTDLGVLPESPVSYTIHESGGIYYARNGSTGATTSNANVDTLITACIVAGGIHFYIKSGITWAIVGDMVPAGITVVGEDWSTVILEPATDPTITTLQIGFQAQIYYVTVHHYEAGVGVHGDYPIRMYANNTAAANINISNYPHEAIVVETGQVGTDMPGIGVNQYGPGDAFWAGVTGDGVGLNVWIDPGAPAGQSYGITSYLYGTGFGYWGISKSGATGTLMQLATEADVVMFKLLEAVDTDTDMIITSNYKTSGIMVDMYHGTTTFAGTGLKMNYGANTGSFTGKFIDLLNNTVEKYYVDANGSVFITNLIASGQMLNIYNASAGASTATGMLINMHCGAGAYTGYPILIENNTVQKLSVDANGCIYISNLITTGQLYEIYNAAAAGCTATGLYMNFGKGVGAYTGNFIACYDDDAAQFTVAYDGDTHIYGTLTVDSTLNVVTSIQVNGTKVVDNQGAVIADVAAGAGDSDGVARTAINTILSRLRAHGLIDT